MGDLKDTITIKDTEITMYSGTLNEIGKYLGVAEIGNAFTNAETKQQIVSAILRDRKNKKEVAYILDPDLLTATDFETLLTWGVEHYSNFIEKSTASMAPVVQRMGQKIQTMMKDLEAGANG